MNQQIKTLTTLDGNTLMSQEFEPLSFAVEKILPHGVFILAGSGKIGKSWLSLDICTAVATGGKLWEFAAEQGEVLYLALEDTYPRLQSRLMLIQEEKVDIARLHLATASLGIGDGLLEQIHSFLTAHPNTKLIVIDTLERIRNVDFDKSMYSCDYRDMTKLREITNAYKLTLLLVHHTRKMYDPDPLNTLSGSTGLVGAVDGIFVLEKEKRTGSKGKLTIANRDTEGFCFKVEFDPDKCRWLFVGNDVEGDDDGEPLLDLVDDFVKESWRGTATELCSEMKKADSNLECSPSTITKKLKAWESVFKEQLGINVTFERSHSQKLISLTRE